VQSHFFLWIFQVLAICENSGSGAGKRLWYFLSTAISTKKQTHLRRGHPMNFLTLSAACLIVWYQGNEMSDLVAYVDGGCHGSPGPAGIGVIIEKPDGEMIRIARWIGHHDNNVAEYAALLEALRCAVDMEATALHVYSDSELVVKQMTGIYACRSPRLYSLNWVCRKLARSLKFRIAHIPRERNQEANRLANHAVRFRTQSPELSLQGV
jgi:ribonuclease HI